MLHHDVHGRPYITPAHGWRCSLCDLPFAVDAALFMIQGDERRAYYTNQQCETVPVCASCLAELPKRHRVRMQKANWKVRCMGCEREMIACVENFQKNTCSEKCEQATARRKR